MKLREALISLLRPNIFSFKRLWIAPESTVSPPESIRTASCSFLAFYTLGRRGSGGWMQRVLGAPWTPPPQWPRDQGWYPFMTKQPDTLLLSLPLSSELLHPGRTLLPRTHKVKRSVFDRNLKVSISKISCSPRTLSPWSFFFLYYFLLIIQLLKVTFQLQLL